MKLIILNAVILWLLIAIIAAYLSNRQITTNNELLITRETYSAIIIETWNRGRFAERRTGFGYSIEDSFKSDTTYLYSQYDSLLIGKQFKPLYK